MSLTEELLAAIETTPSLEEDSESYYHLLMTRVDEALLLPPEDGEEESKWEDNQARRESEVELRNVPRTSDGKHRDKSSYVLSFFLAGVSPLQALTYMSDASNYTYIHPYVQTVNIVERKREEEVGEDGGEEGLGTEYTEALLGVRLWGCGCLPLRASIHTKFCLERGRRRLTVWEKWGSLEKCHTYTFEEEHRGTWVRDVVSVKHIPSFLSCLIFPCSSSRGGREGGGAGGRAGGRGLPLSQLQHVRSMQRLKTILEMDDERGYATDSSCQSLFTDL